MPSISTPINPLNIPGPRDETVEDYCTWQQSKVKKPTLKVEYQKACDVIIEDGMDLELIRLSNYHNLRWLGVQGL
jgi:hypothetical protein